jgi:hypothetical protein
LYSSKLFDQKTQRLKSNVVNAVTTSTEINSQAKKNDSLEDELYTFLNPISSNQQDKRKQHTIESEIQSYNSLKIERSDFSTFWFHNELKHPFLAKLVRFVCCAPPSTVSSERDFSMGSDIITSKRNKLSDKRVEYLSFSKRNLKNNLNNSIFK